MPMIDYQVIASGDSVSWSSETLSTSSLLLGRSSVTAYSIGVRFRGVTIPVGAKITSSYISFRFNIYSGVPPECVLNFEKAGNPAQISSAVDGYGRAKSTASVPVTGPTEGEWWSTYDVSDIIQELVNAYNYASGAAMQCIVTYSGGSGSNFSRQYSYDFSHVYAPKLHIEYAIGCPRQTMFFKMMG